MIRKSALEKGRSQQLARLALRGTVTGSFPASENTISALKVWIVPTPALPTGRRILVSSTHCRLAAHGARHSTGPHKPPRSHDPTILDPAILGIPPPRSLCSVVRYPALLAGWCPACLDVATNKGEKRRRSRDRVPLRRPHAHPTAPPLRSSIRLPTRLPVRGLG